MTLPAKVLQAHGSYGVCLDKSPNLVQAQSLSNVLSAIE